MRIVEPWVLGIDFGTSFTVAAQRIGPRSPEVIELGGERRMPSVLVIDPQGNTVVGRAAENLSTAHPNRTIRAPKSRLGDPSPVVLGGRPYSAVDLVAAPLRAVYLEAVRSVARPPDDVRLTYPAVWPAARSAQLLEAAVRAGIPRPVLVAEPVAAAAAYAESGAIADGACVAVYDLGGGTFDSAVLQAGQGGFVVIGRPGGEDRLGGNLFDELLANHLGSRLDPQVWENLQVSDELAWQQAASTLRAEARKAKEALSSYPLADVLVALPGGMEHLQVHRAELDALTRPYLRDSVEALRRSIDDAGLGGRSLAAIFLTGGASRMPLVEEMVSQSFPGVVVSRRGDPKTAVALGATLDLALTSGRPGTAPWDVAGLRAGTAAGPNGPALGAFDGTLVVPATGPPIALAPPSKPWPGAAGTQPAPPSPPLVAAGEPPPTTWPPALLSTGAGSAPSGNRRRRVLWVAVAILSGLLISGGVWVRFSPGGPSKVGSIADSAMGTTASRQSATSAARPTSTAPTVTSEASPTSGMAPAPTTGRTPPTVPATAVGTNPPPSTTAGSGVTCPQSANVQNRTPAGPTMAIVEYRTADFVARICWTGTEYLYYGHDRADETISVLLAAQPSGSGWQAVSGSYTYAINNGALTVYEKGAVILNQAIVSTIPYR